MSVYHGRIFCGCGKYTTATSMSEFFYNTFDEVCPKCGATKSWTKKVGRWVRRGPFKLFDPLTWFTEEWEDADD